MQLQNIIIRKAPNHKLFRKKSSYNFKEQQKLPLVTIHPTKQFIAYLDCIKVLNRYYFDLIILFSDYALGRSRTRVAGYEPTPLTRVPMLLPLPWHNFFYYYFENVLVANYPNYPQQSFFLFSLSATSLCAETEVRNF